MASLPTSMVPPPPAYYTAEFNDGILVSTAPVAHTDVQAYALREATKAQIERGAAADAVTPENKAGGDMPGFDMMLSWARRGGLGIEKLLAHTDLIDAHFLVDLARNGGILPRCQDVPEEARIKPSEIWRLQRCSLGDGYVGNLAILVLSYPWYDKFHPDRLGEQLCRIANVLELLLHEAKYGTFGGGEHGTVGVMVDYSSVPQIPRISEEALRFDNALGDMHRWYSHPFTHVLLMTTDIPADVGYSNTKSYSQRGWCFFEMRTSSLVKSNRCLWDFSRYTAEVRTYTDALKQMTTGRPPPMSPTRVAEEMRARIERGELFFSYASDTELVIRSYEDGFIATFQEYSHLLNNEPEAYFIWYRRLEWGDSEAPILAEAISFIEGHCDVSTKLSLSLKGNKFSPASIEAISSACISKIAVSFD